MDARLVLFSRDLSPRHTFLTHLCTFYLRFYAFFLIVYGLVVWFLQLVWVCTRNAWCTRWLFLCYSSTITVLKGLTVKPLVSIYCVAVIRYTISWAVCGREWRSVPLLQWRRGCCFFFLPGPETARYARWCNTYKGVLKPNSPWYPCKYTPHMVDRNITERDGLLISPQNTMMLWKERVRVTGHNQDGKRCCDSVRTAFIFCKWKLPSVRFLLHLPQFNHVFHLLIIFHPHDTDSSLTAYCIL